MEGQYFVYRHIRLDTNVPFYIGIGKKPKEFSSIKKEYSRAYETSHRSEYWKRVTAKTDHRVEILWECNTRKEAITKEIEFIALYGRTRNGGTLVNLTLGGEGRLGHTLTKEQKIKMSEAFKNARQSKEYREKMSRAQKGIKRSLKTKANCKEAQRKICRPVKDVLTNRTYRSLADACDHLGVDKGVEVHKLRRNSPRTRFIYLEDYDKIQREFTDN